jgi:hypothetical protein
MKFGYLDLKTNRALDILTKLGVIVENRMLEDPNPYFQPGSVHKLCPKVFYNIILFVLKVFGFKRDYNIIKNFFT